MALQECQCRGRVSVQPGTSGNGLYLTSYFKSQEFDVLLGNSRCKVLSISLTKTKSLI